MLSLSFVENRIISKVLKSKTDINQQSIQACSRVGWHRFPANLQTIFQRVILNICDQALLCNNAYMTFSATVICSCRLDITRNGDTMRISHFLVKQYHRIYHQQRISGKFKTKTAAGTIIPRVDFGEGMYFDDYQKINLGELLKSGIFFFYRIKCMFWDWIIDW